MVGGGLVAIEMEWMSDVGQNKKKKIKSIFNN